MTPKREYYYSEKCLHTTIKKTLRTYGRNCSRGETYSCTQSRCQRQNLLRTAAHYTEKHKIETRGARPKKDATQTVRKTRGTAPQWSIFFLSRFLDHQNGILSAETRKQTANNRPAPVIEHQTVPNMGPEPRLVWFANALLPHCPESPHCLREASEVN